MTVKNELKKSLPLAMILFLVFSLTSTTAFQMDIYDVSSGGYQTTSSGFKTNVILGGISKNITSTLYKNFIGFWYTIIGAGAGALGDTTPPSISFVSSTPLNNTQVNNTFIYINVTTSDDNNHSAFIDWNRSLVGWWNFESTNTTGVHDNSTYDNFAAFTGTISQSDITTGIRGNALNFSGINQYLYIGTQELIANKSSLTVSAWVKTTSSSRQGIYSESEDAGQEDFMQLNTNNGKAEGFTRANDGTLHTLTGTADINDNQWHHLVLTKNITTHQLFVDGVLENTSTFSVDYYDIEQVTIGSRWSEGNPLNLFAGDIDEVMIFKRALTPQEINASYNAGDWRLYNNFTGLSDGSYTARAWVIDESGNINNTELRTFTIDDNVAPSITLNSPPNASKTKNRYQLLNATVYDDDPDPDSLTGKLYGYYADEINASLDTGLVFLMHLNNDSSLGESDTHFYDSALGINNGSCTPNCPTFVNGKLNGAYEFDGLTNYINVPYDASYDQLGDRITISVWIKAKSPIDLGTYPGSMIINRWFNPWPWVMTMNTTNYINWNAPDSGGNKGIWSSEPINLNEWTHIVGLFNGTHNVLYINAQESNKIARADEAIISSGSNGLRIGERVILGNMRFNGSIDEVAIWNRSLTSQEIKSLYDITRYKLLYQEDNLVNNTAFTYNLTAMPLSVDKDMIVLMHFDNDSTVGENDTHVYDWTTIGNNGTCEATACPTLDYTDSVFGGAYYFDGINDHFNITNSASLDSATGAGQERSVSLWFKMIHSGARVIIEKGIGNHFYIIQSSADKIAWSCEGGSSNDILSDNSLNDGEWHHFVGTYDAIVNLTMYIDGQKQSDTTPPSAACPPDDGVNIIIGKRAGNVVPFNGSLDDIAIWNRSLTASEVQNIYQLQVGRYYWKGNVTDGRIINESNAWYFDIEPDYLPVVTNIQDLPTQSVTEGGLAPVTFWALITDNNSYTDISVVNATFNMTSETTRYNASCSFVENISAYSANYSCTIGLWYFEGAGDWDITVIATDVNGNASNPLINNFTLDSTTSMNLTTTDVTFISVSVTSKNITADNNITIENIANDPLTVVMNASELQGQTITTQYIYAENFSINYTGNGCSGDKLLNNTDVTITGLTISKGNNTNNEGIQDLALCLTELPSGIQSQTYTTTTGRPWYVIVS
ncbi:LamG domain-containing protein [Candidatus Woesearchaeota archaeon]|nr:LamG domain-containing protein [Candidatus Woesearchaeota archaeon]